MNERIKELRKTLNLTQQEFADRISIKRGAIANYEIGRNEPTDAVLSLICREFNVNDEWLKYGTGEMFNTLTKNAQLARFFGLVNSDSEDSFKRRLITALSVLDEQDWVALEKIAKEIIENKKD